MTGRQANLGRLDLEWLGPGVWVDIIPHEDLEGGRGRIVSVIGPGCRVHPSQAFVWFGRKDGDTQRSYNVYRLVILRERLFDGGAKSYLVLPERWWHLLKKSDDQPGQVEKTWPPDTFEDL